MAGPFRAATDARGSPSPRSRAIGVVLVLMATLLGVLYPTAAGAREVRAVHIAAAGIASDGAGSAATAPAPHATQAGIPTDPADPSAATHAGPALGAPDVEGRESAPPAVHDFVDDATRDARRGPAPPRVSGDPPSERHHAHLDNATLASCPRVSPSAAGRRHLSSPDLTGPTSHSSRPPCRAPPTPPGT